MGCGMRDFRRFLAELEPELLKEFRHVHERGSVPRIYGSCNPEL